MRVLIVTFVLIFGSIHSLSAQEDTTRFGYGKTIEQLCDSFPTDKCPLYHNFVEVYDRLFEPRRDSMNKFLEIGILYGLSHLMWREYFPHAEVYGIDIKDFSAYAEGTGIHTYVADQSNREQLQGFIDTYGSDYEVILDDGGHAMDHQQVSLGFFFKHLEPGGYYIIEDVHTSLPAYYSDPRFKVNERGDNTTLLMIENFIRTRQIRSYYMTEEEALYLQKNIETVELIFRDNSRHSIMCVIKKKDRR